MHRHISVAASVHCQYRWTKRLDALATRRRTGKDATDEPGHQCHPTKSAIYDVGCARRVFHVLQHGRILNSARNCRAAVRCDDPDDSRSCSPTLASAAHVCTAHQNKPRRDGRVHKYTNTDRTHMKQRNHYAVCTRVPRRLSRQYGNDKNTNKNKTC